jgi:CPA2 family monovalent cation:H+ antiporter-2
VLGEGGVALVPAAGDIVRTSGLIGVVLLLLALGLEFSTEEFLNSARRHVGGAGCHATR